MKIKSRLLILCLLLMLPASLMTQALTAIAAPVQTADYPGNQITITGNNQEFRITSGGNQMFGIADMLPGERSELATITIANTQSLPFTVSITVRDAGSNSDLLLNYLDIVVLLDGNVIANFPAKGQSGSQARPNPYPIGRIPANTTTDIQVGLEFANAANAKNSLQETAAHIVWVVTAVSEQPSPTPAPGPEPTPTPAPGTGGIFAGLTTYTDDTTSDVGDANLPAPTTPATNLPDLVNVPEPEPPLSDVDRTGDADKAWALLNLLLTLGSIVLALVTLLLRSRRQQEQNPSAKNFNTTRTSTTNFATREDAVVSTRNSAAREDEEQRRRRLISRVAGAVFAVLAIVLFLLTEDITLPMRWVDIWTPAHIVIFLLVAALLLVSQRGAGKARQQTNSEIDQFRPGV
jgi:hypothetical protein